MAENLYDLAQIISSLPSFSGRPNTMSGASGLFGQLSQRQRAEADKANRAKTLQGLFGQRQQTRPQEGPVQLGQAPQKIVTQPGSGLLGSQRKPEDMEKFYKGLMSVPGYEKTAVNALSGNNSTGDKGMPSTVQEWKYYNSLSKEDQARFLQMKRNSNQIIKLGGVPTNVSTIPGVNPTKISSLADERRGQSAIAGSREQAVGKVKGEQQRLNSLRGSRAGRDSNINKAKKFLTLLENDKLQTGAGRKIAGYIPGVYTDQGALDEEFNAFAEVAARQALKASGEIRPTDADVTGMKRAMFGIGRDEKVNINLLKDFIAQQESDSNEYSKLSSGSVEQKESALPPVNQNGWKLMVDANGNKAYVSQKGEIKEVGDGF